MLGQNAPLPASLGEGTRTPPVPQRHRAWHKPSQPDRHNRGSHIVPHTETVRAYVDAFNAGEWERLKNLFDPAANIRGVLG
jgi:hypothetical protein